MPLHYNQEYRYGGLDAPLLLDQKIRRRRDGLDGGTLKYLSQDRDTFLPDQAAPTTGLTGLIIEEVESEQVGEIDWEHNLMVVGILGNRLERREIGYPRIHERQVGWDDLTDSIITTNPQSYGRGVIHATYGNMICMESPRDNIYGNYWRVQPQYQGLLNAKNYYKRQITVNEEVMSPQDPVIVTLPGGWTTARKAQVSMPKIVVKDSQMVFGPSPTVIIPGRYTPPNPPAIQSLSMSGSDLTWRWPSLWKLASIDRDEIPGLDCALQVLTYEYVWPASF